MKTLKERFWEKVDKSGNCWEWKAALTTKGYGYFYYKGVLTNAHRVSYEIANGLIPEEMCVCHTCDNRKCVNPKHLWLGTIADNNKDMVDKGRSINSGAKGSLNGNSKLTRQDIVDIRLQKERGVAVSSLAMSYGISRQHVHRISKRKRWKHV